MSNTETTVTPETNTTPATTETNTKEKEISTTVDKFTPESTASKSKTEVKTDLEILDDTNSLCNTVLYVLTKGFYPGADAHLVNQSKEFVKAIKTDIANRRKSVVDNHDVNGKPLESK